MIFPQGEAPCRGHCTAFKCSVLSTGYPRNSILTPQSNSPLKFTEKVSFTPLQREAKARSAAAPPVAVSAPDPAPEEATAAAERPVVAVAAAVSVAVAGRLAAVAVQLVAVAGLAAVAG